MTRSCTATAVPIPSETATTMRVALNKETRQSAGIDPDDAVIVTTDTAHLAARAYEEQCWEAYTCPVVGLNSLHRETLGIELDGIVRIKACTPAAATSITIQADVPMCRPFGPEDPEELRRALYHRPLLSDARFWLMSEACQQFGVIPGEWHPLRVVDAEPDGPVYIDEETVIRTPQRRFPSEFDSEQEAASSAGSWEAIRARVLSRDERACQNPRCSGESTDLQVHFVVPPRTRGTVDPANLVTLCRECHEATHNRRLRPTR